MGEKTTDFDQNGGNDNKYQENLPNVNMTRLLAKDSTLNRIKNNLDKMESLI